MRPMNKIMAIAGVVAVIAVGMVLNVRLLPARADSYWTQVDQGQWQLDLPRFTQVLEPVAQGEAVTIVLPSPHGELEQFEVRATSTMDPRLAAAHPEIITAAGDSAEHPSSQVRLELTGLGLGAEVSDGWVVTARNLNEVTHYRSEPAQPTARSNPTNDLLPDSERRALARLDHHDGPAGGEAISLRVYRLALLSDPDLAYLLGDRVLDAKVTLVNRANAVFERDLATRLELIPETPKLSFSDFADATEAGGLCGPIGCLPADVVHDCSERVDPYSDALSLIVGDENYDGGHYLGGMQGNGVAQIGSVGVGGGGKGSACSAIVADISNGYGTEVFVHELGHQFGASHSFGADCGDGGELGTEVGSGGSVMSYAGVCPGEDYQHRRDLYFHHTSVAQIQQTQLADNTSDEIQLVLFDSDGSGDGFRIAHAGGISEPIVLGESYTTEGVTAALAEVGLRAFASSVGTEEELTAEGFKVYYVDTLRDESPLEILPDSGVTAHVRTLVNGGSGTNGGTVTLTDNHVPTVIAPPSHTIPTRTPFVLTGEADDLDGDSLWFTWEQSDPAPPEGAPLLTNAKTSGPLFPQFGTRNRGYAWDSEDPADLNHPSAEPQRHFPDLQQVLAGNTNAETGDCPGNLDNPWEMSDDDVDCFAEFLPTSDYADELNFVLTARDNNQPAGGFGTATTVLTVDHEAGPFLVTSQSTSKDVEAGTSGQVTWAVNGTDKPELAEKVDIVMSDDGGESFDIALAVGIPNDGQAEITWPNRPIERARLMIKASDNIFYDVNDADFSVVDRTGPSVDPTATTAPSVDPTPPSPTSDPEPVPTTLPSPSSLPTSSVAPSATGAPSPDGDGVVGASGSPTGGIIPDIGSEPTDPDRHLADTGAPADLLVMLLAGVTLTVAGSMIGRGTRN